MARLGPFEARPFLAAAVSGGADSTAMALLARDWARARDGRIIAFIIDHGLRPESANEAVLTAQRLDRAGIPSRIIALTGLPRGPALAERARIRRYGALTDACRDAGCLHLLLGHHAADQQETLAMRVLRGSRNEGLAGMAALRETPSLRLLRPLLGVGPGALRRYLAENAACWVEDPSNRDRRALRSRLRAGFAGRTAAVLSQAIACAGRQRARNEDAAAAVLAARASIRPEGFAVVGPEWLTEAALASLVRTIGSAPYPPDPDRVADLVRRPGPATLAGVRIAPAGRLGGWMVLREEDAVEGPVEASSDTAWDRRFRLIAHAPLPAGATIGKLGDDSARFRGMSVLPSAVLRTLPALRIGKMLAAVPHLRYASGEGNPRVTVLFSPSRPAAGPGFRSSDGI